MRVAIRWVAVLVATAFAGFVTPGDAATADSRAEGTQSAWLAATGPALPAVLSPGDARLYRRIFDLGEDGHWDEVDRLVARLDDRLLLGHVLAQRYLHPTKYRTPFRELRDWLADYHDLPQAARLYKLAQRRRPLGAPAVQRPTYRRGDHAAGAGLRSTQRVRPPERRRSAAQRRQARQILRRVHRNVMRTRLTVSERLLARDDVRGVLTPFERARGYAEVAAGWYHYGNDDKAARVAGQAVDLTATRPRECVPGAHWIAGLAAWRRDALSRAAPQFEALAGCVHASPWQRAAGAYWAARAHLRLRQPARMSHWLRLAARNPRTFYGQLAHQALGTHAPLGFDDGEVRQADLDRLLDSAAGRRALALFQIGRRERARGELLGVDGWDRPAMVGALLLAAERGGLPALAFRLGSRLADADAPGWSRGAINAAMYPIPPWRPATGFRIDRALLFALVRQESGFDPEARSGAGARGLMQLMPATASYMARRDNFRYTHAALDRPELNLDLGQRYIGYLLDSRYVRANLFDLAAAYNGGPGNLVKWRRGTAFDGDPLLFIESLPSRETRLFIERVLTNLWIYRQRLGQPAPSRAAIAAGDWPRYQPLDRVAREVAQR